MNNSFVSPTLFAILSILMLASCSDNMNTDELINGDVVEPVQPVFFWSVMGEIELSQKTSSSIRRAIRESKVETLNRPPNNGIPMATIEVDGEKYAIGSPNPPGLYVRSYQGGKPALVKHPMFDDLGNYAGLLSDELADSEDINRSQQVIESWFDNK